MYIHKNIILTRSFPVYGWIADNINLYGLLTLANDAIDLSHLNVATTYTRDATYKTLTIINRQYLLYGAFAEGVTAGLYSIHDYTEVSLANTWIATN